MSRPLTSASTPRFQIARRLGLVTFLADTLLEWQERARSRHLNAVGARQIEYLRQVYPTLGRVPAHIPELPERRPRVGSTCRWP